MSLLTLFRTPRRSVFSRLHLPRLLLVWALLFLVRAGQAQNGPAIAELQHQLQAAHSDSARARLSGLLAWELRFSDSARARQLAKQEIRLAAAQRNNLLLADGFRINALILVIERKVPDGLEQYDSAIFYARRAKSLYYESSCYSLIAGMYGDHGDYEKAIEHYARGLELAMRSKDPVQISTLSNNLAESYQSEGREPALTEKYFMMALDNSMEAGDYPRASMNSANLAQEYLNNGQKQHCITELKRAVDLLNRNPENAYQFATTSHVLASVYFDLGLTQEAEQYALRSIHIMDSLERPDNALRPLTVLTQVYLKTGDLNKAELFGQRLLHDGQQRNAQRYIRDGYKALSDIARLRNDYPAALRYFELYKAWNDSVFRIAREQSISNLEIKATLAQKELAVKYQTEEKDRENENLKGRNGLLQTEKFITLLACLVFLALGILLYISNRKKQKINAELQVEKKLVQQQVQEKGMLVHEIHHRVKNNLTMLKSLLYLQSRSLAQPEARAILEESQSRIQSMAIVHEHLYEENEEGQLDFRIFLENLLSELTQGFRPGGAIIHYEIQGECRELNIAQAIPLGLIMNELVTNSLKYAFLQKPDGLIRVMIQETDGVLRIRYADSGPGLQKELDLTAGGFGYKVIHILIKQLGATLSYRKASGFTIEMAL